MFLSGEPCKYFTGLEACRLSQLDLIGLLCFDGLCFDGLFDGLLETLRLEMKKSFPAQLRYPSLLHIAHLLGDFAISSSIRYFRASSKSS